MSEYTCFVISPIGAEGTELYEEYKDLLELIIIPALEIYNIKVKRGDHFIAEDKIDDSVIKNIQDADICICDISIPNPNVYYELGRRDETGKPVLLLKKKGTAQSPVDIATRRFFEYEWEGRYAIRDAQNHIRSFVEPLISQGFESRATSASLSEIADCLSRLERKIDRLEKNKGLSVPAISADVVESSDNTDPVDKLKYALMQRNIPMAEEAMAQLSYRMDKLPFYDQVVEQVACMGSKKAGEMLIEMAEEFFDSDMSLKKKSEYLGCLVSYLNKTDKEEEQLDLVLQVSKRLEAEAGSENPDIMASVYNQQNRLYHGIFGSTGDLQWLDKAIAALKQGLAHKDVEYIYYNLATCYWRYARTTKDVEKYQLAKNAIEGCLAREDEDDKDHLELACKIYAVTNDPKLEEALQRIVKLDPIAAKLLLNELKKL